MSPPQREGCLLNKLFALGVDLLSKAPSKLEPNVSTSLETFESELSLGALWGPARSVTLWPCCTCCGNRDSGPGPSGQTSPSVTRGQPFGSSSPPQFSDTGHPWPERHHRLRSCDFGYRGCRNYGPCKKKKKTNPELSKIPFLELGVGQNSFVCFVCCQE